MANIIDMPKLSDTMTVGTLLKWLKNEGDAVATGDMLAEVETDKATMELESFFDGTLLKIFVPAGSQVPIGAPLCAVGKPGEKVDAPAAAAPEAKADSEKKKEDPEKSAAPGDKKDQADKQAVKEPETAPKPAASASPKTPAAPPPPASPAPEGRIKISPLARKLAEEKGIDPSRVSGSGPGGRIVREDILAAGKSGQQKLPSAFAGNSPSKSGPIQEEKRVPLSNMRATVARRTLESKTQVPHIYLDIDIDAEPLLAIRAQLNSGLEHEGVKLSVNDFILKASAEALRRVPAVNCSWESEGILQHGSAHVSFAVAIPDGLITPVIRDTHLKSIFAISSEAKSLAKLAKDRKLQPAQYTGGTFCVSNLGMMGIDRFDAIINLPNAAILAVGATVKKPVVKNDQIVIGQRMILTLSCDHRVIDGAIGATYLAALRELLEKPALLLV